MPSILGSKAIGARVHMMEDGTQRNYIVVHQGIPSADYVGFGGGTVLLRENTLLVRPMHSTDVNDYANSDLHAWLNNAATGFLSTLDTAVRDLIHEVRIPFRPGSGNSPNVSSGTNGLLCRVYQLSAEEVRLRQQDGPAFQTHYPHAEGITLSGFINENVGAGRYIALNDEGDTSLWWLRTPMINNPTPLSFFTINRNGNRGTTRASSSVVTPIRPRPSFVLPSSTPVSDTNFIDGTNDPEELPPPLPPGPDISGVNGQFRRAYITPQRVYDNPANTDISPFDIALPVTVLQAVVDPNTGDTLDRILNRILDELDLEEIEPPPPPPPPEYTHEILTPLSQARSTLASATDGIGNVLFGGGIADNIRRDTVDLYNNAGVRTTLTSMSEVSTSLSAATDGNGNVLFIGGRRASLTPSNVVNRYNNIGVRTILTALSQARGSGAASTDGDGNVLFGGGARTTNLDAYDIVDRYNTAGTRTVISALSQARHIFDASTDGVGNVLFGGGSGVVPSDIVDRYNTAGTRTTLTTLSQARHRLSASTDGDGNVLFGGGQSGLEFFNYVDRYNNTGTRTTLTTLSQAKAGLSATTDGTGNVLFGGGNIGSGVFSAAVDSYNTVGTRTILTALSQARDQLAASTDGDGNALFGGGRVGGGTSSTVDRYRIVT